MKVVDSVTFTNYNKFPKYNLENPTFFIEFFNIDLVAHPQRKFP